MQTLISRYKCTKCGSKNVSLAALQDTKIWYVWDDELDEYKETIRFTFGIRCLMIDCKDCGYGGFITM